jgi:hypothetical protein
MKMILTRTLSKYGITCFALILFGCGSTQSLSAQKGKNKGKDKAPTVISPTEKAPVESVNANNNAAFLPAVTPDQNNVTEEQLNQQLRSKLKFTPYTRTAPVKSKHQRRTRLGRS